MLPGNVAIAPLLQHNTNASGVLEFITVRLPLSKEQICYHLNGNLMFLSLRQHKQMCFLSFESSAGYTCWFCLNREALTLVTSTLVRSPQGMETVIWLSYRSKWMCHTMDTSLGSTQSNYAIFADERGKTFLLRHDLVSFLSCHVLNDKNWHGFWFRKDALTPFPLNLCFYNPWLESPPNISSCFPNGEGEIKL